MVTWILIPCKHCTLSDQLSGKRYSRMAAEDVKSFWGQFSKAAMILWNMHGIKLGLQINKTVLSIN